MARILIVDDDKNICQLLKLYLSREGFDLIFAHDGSNALDALGSNDIDLIILDIMLPQINGWEVCELIRKESTIPVIMLTARNLVEDKIQGFDIGADDYIVKPFDPKEVVARVKVQLKNKALRNSPEKQSLKSGDLLKIGDVEVDIDRYEIRINDQKVDVKPKEIQLLYFMLKNKNIVFKREKLLEKVWDYSYEGDTRTVDVHINRLREKLEGTCTAFRIRTIYGVGYKLETDAKD